MEKTYDPSSVEKRVYKMWEDGGYFTPKIDQTKKPFSIILPLPNANDPMHMGHAMFTVQDILIRWHRMLGDPTLWLPGGDHAGIETQYVFEKKLAKEGKSRFQFDRETLYKMISEFVDNNKNINRNQMKRLGFSLDWTRYHYSLEPEIVDNVMNTFIKLYDDGLVYRTSRMVNFCTKCGTAFSDLEINHEEKNDTLYYLDYGPINIATARPETIFADVAVAVNNKDKRYANFVGQKATIPLINKRIPIISDNSIDINFGTGALKVTPAHDQLDYEIGIKNHLEPISTIDRTGRMIQVPSAYLGLKISQARIKAIEDLRSKNKIIKTEPLVHTVSVCYRCKTTIEPLLIPQWYVKTKTLAKSAIDAVKKGRTKIEPLPRFKKMYFDWLNKITDWNISRQIVWGPQLPVWYCVSGFEHEIWVSFIDKTKTVHQGSIREHYNNGFSFDDIKKGLQQIIVPLFKESKNQPQISIGTQAPQGDGWIRETDTFDTWFLSAQWPLTTLGYPDNSDFKYFYPTSVLDTMWDILFFWVARMMMLGIYRTGNVPFQTIHLHSRVVDKKGQKMSKSRGNVINPLEMAGKYGADALRFALVFGAAPGSDIALSEDKIRGMRNFANKIWNIGRFTITQFESDIFKSKEVPFYNEKIHKQLAPSEKQIISELNMLTAQVTNDLTKYRFSDAAQKIYEFTWHRLADIYLEEAKVKLTEGDVLVLSALRHVLLNVLKLLHPFMPFVTEEVWSQVPRKYYQPLIISSWPK